MLPLKLNELIAAKRFTSIRLLSCENISEEELHVIKKYYERVSQIAK